MVYIMRALPGSICARVRTYMRLRIGMRRGGLAPQRAVTGYRDATAHAMPAVACGHAFSVSTPLSLKRSISLKHVIRINVIGPIEVDFSRNALLNGTTCYLLRAEYMLLRHESSMCGQLLLAIAPVVENDFPGRFFEREAGK